MKRTIAAALSALSLAALAAASAPRTAHAAEEGRFDAQVFRPLAAPRDLVMVPKTEVIGHLSPVLGLYWDAALNPLALAIGDTNKTLNAVGARLQITPLLGIGLFDWMELTMAVPFVAWQTSDNLRSIGTEGTIKQTPGLGDVRVSSKVAIPYFNRKDEVKSGFGLAVSGNINLPTGDELAFTSDGALSGGVSLIADYRFNFGLLLASNLGVWLRPEHQFAGVKVGDMAQFGVAGEMYIVQRWGLSVIGEVYGYPSLTKYPDDATQIPAEVLLGIRWQTRQGITITIGGSFGAACGFGAPAIRVFNSVTWQPKSSVEQQEINRLQERDSVDPDHDGLVGEADKCPDKPGRPDYFGCPEQNFNRDGDKWPDAVDKCPNEAGGYGSTDGCPRVFVRDGEIVVLDKVNFATDKDVILDESKPILLMVRRVLLDHPEIREVEIQGHTDVRASDAYNLDLSKRRVESVRTWLIHQGVEPDRLTAKGKGHMEPIEDDKGCLGPDETLTPECVEKTSKNRRVLFLIKKYGESRKAIAGGNNADVNILSAENKVLSEAESELPMCRPVATKDKPASGCVLPAKNSVIKEKSILQKSKDAPALPSPNQLPTPNQLPSSNGSSLPTIDQGNLPHM